MASIKRRIDADRASLMEMVHLVDALGWITLSATKESIDWSAHIKKHIPLLTKKQLKAILQSTADILHTLKVRFRPKLKDEDCLKMYDTAISGSPHPNTAHYIQLTWFKMHFSLDNEIGEGMARWPKHSLIELHNNARDEARGHRVAFIVPETRLYEDMAVLYNRAWALEKQPGAYNQDKDFLVKELRASMSSCVLMALNFVESYLNGLGLCIILDESKMKTLKSGDIGLLLEKDPRDATRTKFTSFEKKILSYPRLFLNADFPPIQQSNCPEFAIIMEKGKKYRDSLAHPSFSPDLEIDNVSGNFNVDFNTQKMQVIIGISFNEVTEIIDAAVGLVKRIDKLTYDWTDTIIFKRDADGKFPDESFA